MSTFLSATFGLSKGNKIIARAKAKNIKGFCSTYSPSDTWRFTLVVEKEPIAPLKPIEGVDNTWNVLHVKWTALADYSVESGGVTAAI